MKRAFLFGLTAQLIFISAIFLVFDDLMLPMTRSPVIGIVALGLGVASAFFAWGATPHPSWLVKIGMWIAGFLAIYVVIPFIEVVVVLTIPLISN
ncbi:hypothetical protein [Mesorhizobium sp.]|uniref:hypothetical protein n=1 Tax=Mesorhizobium sp. TaxID=1871066 RepID=UPI0012049A66|nr:hypothetical protein [Mesorhizobium sp.]TIO10747.1 MAG: hypothetical protein E5X88_02970 [Mesorhizobium sp.]TIO35309.1 MAG: hypothetical protein E5X89_08590 [Mesorhizobium sp.]